MPTKEKKTTTERPPRKTKSSAGGGKKKLSAFNKFMQSELARLKDTDPDMPHQERFKQATANWKKAKDKATTA